jgi:hypothetical protein
MTAIYALVKRYLREGKAPSRNQAFDAYNEPDLARALRIYRHLYTLQEDIRALLAQKEECLFRITLPKDSQGRYRLHFQRGQMIRTAFLTHEEWDLLRDDSEVAAFLGHHSPRKPRVATGK